MRRRGNKGDGRAVFREGWHGTVWDGERGEMVVVRKGGGTGAWSRLGWTLLSGLVLVAAVCAGQAKPKIGAVTLRAFHLLYPDYSQTFTVGLNQKFQLADTNLFVAVEEFVPHFAIDTVTRKVFSQSQELKNPAFKVAVFVGAERKEEQWAFFKFAVPHFTRQTGLRFEVLKFNYNGKTHRREKAK